MLSLVQEKRFLLAFMNTLSSEQLADMNGTNRATFKVSISVKRDDLECLRLLMHYVVNGEDELAAACAIHLERDHGLDGEWYLFWRVSLTISARLAFDIIVINYLPLTSLWRQAYFRREN